MKFTPKLGFISKIRKVPALINMSKDASLKIISVMIALVLWLFVYNDNNPIKDYKFNVQLKVINQDSLKDKGIVLKSYEQYIVVRVRGRVEDLKNVSEKDFEAYLDFSKVVSASETTIEIDKPKARGNFEIYDYTRFVRVDMEKYETKSFPVEIVLQGEPKKGYKIVNTSFEPKTINIDGLESTIRAISSVKVYVDVSNLDRDITNRKYECKVYDRNDKVMSQLSKNMMVEVSIEVGKEVPVSIVTKGKLDADYIEISRTVEPQKVLVGGNPTILSKIADIKTEPIDMSGIKSDYETSAALKVPDGLHLFDLQREAKVKISVEKLAVSNISIPAQAINLKGAVEDDSLAYEIRTQSLNVNVKGRYSDLDGLIYDVLKPEADVSDLNEGIYKIPVKFYPPSGVKILGAYTVEVKITKKETQIQ